MTCLFYLSFQMQVLDGSESMNEKQVQFGFRTIELVEEPIEGSEGL